MEHVVGVETLAKSVMKLNELSLSEQEAMTDEISRYQPAFLKSFLALQKFVDQNQLGRLFYIMLVMWDALADHPIVRKVEISEDLQDQMADANVRFFKFLGGEKSNADFKAVVESQFDNYRQAPMLSFVFKEIYYDESGFFELPLSLKTQLIIYLKAEIDCIDHVLNTGNGDVF